MEWKFGDRVVHAGRPEWGVGTVSTVEPAVQDGQRCHRLTVRFERGGVKTLSTAFADLRPANSGAIAMLNAEPTDDPLLAAEFKPEEIFCKIPEDAIDPFTSPRKRLEYTLGLYRFSDGGGKLLDWAVAQSGMKDPLSRFNRHELENLYQRFLFNVDQHLKKLVREMHRTEPEVVKQLVAKAHPAAQRALKRLDALR